ncbi:hypothetical protein XENOCAPTIV_029590, partial [Xenoophorus captivus]
LLKTTAKFTVCSLTFELTLPAASLPVNCRPIGVNVPRSDSITRSKLEMLSCVWRRK